MKPVEILGLSIFAAVQSIAWDSGLCQLLAAFCFGVWVWASVRAFKRESEAQAVG